MHIYLRSKNLLVSCGILDHNGVKEHWFLSLIAPAMENMVLIRFDLGLFYFLGHTFLCFSWEQTRNTSLQRSLGRKAAVLVLTGNASWWVPKKGALWFQELHLPDHTGSAWTHQDDAFAVVPVPSAEHVLYRRGAGRQPDSQRGAFNWASCQPKYHFHLNGKEV